MPRKPNTTVFTQSFGLGSENHDICNVFCSKNAGIYAVFSILQEASFPCKKHKQLCKLQCFCLWHAPKKQQESTKQCPTWTLQTLLLPMFGGFVAPQKRENATRVVQACASAVFGRSPVSELAKGTPWQAAPNRTSEAVEACSRQLWLCFQPSCAGVLASCLLALGADFLILKFLVLLVLAPWVVSLFRCWLLALATCVRSPLCRESCLHTVTLKDRLFVLLSIDSIASSSSSCSSSSSSCFLASCSFFLLPLASSSCFLALCSCFFSLFSRSLLLQLDFLLALAPSFSCLLLLLLAW